MAHLPSTRLRFPKRSVDTVVTTRWYSDTKDGTTPQSLGTFPKNSPFKVKATWCISLMKEFSTNVLPGSKAFYRETKEVILGSTRGSSVNDIDIKLKAQKLRNDYVKLVIFFFLQLMPGSIAIIPLVICLRPAILPSYFVTPTIQEYISLIDKDNKRINGNFIVDLVSSYSRLISQESRCALASIDLHTKDIRTNIDLLISMEKDLVKILSNNVVDCSISKAIMTGSIPVFSNRWISDIVFRLHWKKIVKNDSLLVDYCVGDLASEEIARACRLRGLPYEYASMEQRIGMLCGWMYMVRKGVDPCVFVFYSSLWSRLING